MGAAAAGTGLASLIGLLPALTLRRLPVARLPAGD
jgi:hypothetical protein